MVDKKKKVEEKIREVEKEVEKEIIYNVPNFITLTRLILTFVFIYMLFSDYSKLSLIIVFVFAALTDFFDGQIARRFNQKTYFGAKMDQIVDRIFTVFVFFSLLVYFIVNNKNNFVLLLILSVSREIIGMFGVFIAIIKNKNIHHVRYVGKVTTLIQGFAIGAIILEVNWAIYLVIPTCIIGIISGFDYTKHVLEG